MIDTDLGRKLFREPERNIYVPAELTQAEIQTQTELIRLDADIKELTNKRNALMKSCQHKAFFDIAGMPYDVRMCGICGIKLETI